MENNKRLLGGIIGIWKETEVFLLSGGHCIRQGAGRRVCGGENSDGDEKFSLEYGKKKGLQVFSRKINITVLGKKIGAYFRRSWKKSKI